MAPDEDRIELRALGTALWRRKWLILATTLAGALLAYALVSQITPRYTARASVMLDPRTVQILSSDEVVSDLTLNNPLLDTETAVLRSNLLLEKVIAGFDPQRLEAFDPANRPATLKTRLKRNIAGFADRVKASLGRAPAPADEAQAPAAGLLTPEERRLRRLVTALRQSMTVWREGQSYLISVSVETEDPDLSKRFANGIVQEYIASQIRQRSATVRGATDYLAGEVETMRAAVEKAESAVEDFRINQLAESGVSSDTMDQQMLELSTQLSLAQADQASAEARYKQIQSVIDGEGLESAAELLSSPFVLSLREEMASLERQDADLATRYGPEHPDRQRLRASIDRISSDLAGEVRKIVAGLRNDAEVARIRAQSLQDSLTRMESRSADMSRASLELRQLEREADAARSSYEAMLTRLNEARSVEKLQRADARVVEKAVIPGAPSAPRVMLFSALGGAAGLSAGLVLTFLLAVAGAGFRRAGDLEHATGLSALAMLPVGNWRNTRGLLRSLRAMPYQHFADRLRQLRTALGARTAGQPVKSVLITSSIPGEGKTTTAVALAYMEGLARHSCVLLDFDLRRSRLAHDLGYAPRGGDLAAYLKGECSLEAALHHAPQRGFDLLTTRRPEPQLIDEATPARIEALLAELTARYDMVVIDTPPLLLVADTLQLARLADASILLVKQGTTRRSAVIESARRLGEMGAPFLGVAMTMVDPRGEKETYGVSGSYGYGKR